MLGFFRLLSRKTYITLTTSCHSSGMANWSNLPRDVWMLIAQKFSLLRELILFASVCVQWRDVAKVVRGTFLSRPPLLMLPFKEDTHSRNFYDLSTNSIHSINLPELDDRWICGVSNGWLVTLDDKLKIELLNPYSKTKLQLPEHPAISRYQHIRYRSVYRSTYMRKVILTESPNSNQTCFAVSIVTGECRVAICRVGDDKWIDIKSTEPFLYQDITCYKGKIFAIRDGAVVDVVHDFNKITMINGPDDPLLIKEQVEQKYLVESAGDLLMVLRVAHVLLNMERHGLFLKTYMFCVYKLKENMKEWTKIDNLGDRSIFVGGNHSISAKVSGFDGCRSNCIYYLEDEIIHDIGDGCQFDSGLFCLDDGHTEPLPEKVLSFWSAPGFWYMQSL